jgi:hypothetical protein
MHSPTEPKLSDGVIFLQPLRAENAAEHLAGEDQEMARWLSGGRSTLANVQGYIASSQENWRSGGRAALLASSSARPIDWPAALK